MLPMEAETMGMLTIGFWTMMFAMFTVVFIMLLRDRRLEMIWILAHLIVFAMAVRSCLHAIGNRVHPIMASENNSWWLGIGGVLWAISMFLLLGGIVSLATGKIHAELALEANEKEGRPR
ncbi:hypothetical protein [Paenibacillus methanolicus]|uniref:Uncharacterized protein n=1 Tax=Paenibacillus methanolicus TaxID=582686 RepID=A0A5S5CIU2_9BACL|nr:hypothetical protein [Paenibacillus methanolicus]TYP79709.1 hypothetical protein BCM02_101830 [Paenibacillus methanolicus]